MAEAPKTPSRSEHEARRALVHDALTDLATTDDPEAAADEVLRALDGYLGVSEGPLVTAGPREPPVADFADRKDARDARALTWIIVGAAAFATAVVAIAFSGGWAAALAVAAVWGAALFALLST
jgi:hypothetical protein